MSKEHKLQLALILSSLIILGILVFLSIPKYESMTITHDGFNIVTQAKELKVEATAYCGDEITSLGIKPTPYRTIAVDPKVIPYGSTIYIPEYKALFKAEDTGSAIKGKRIDIFLSNEDECKEFGRKNIRIYVLK
jgi:3D (Asp-Asp-Asp) domain-containing protein